MGRASWIGAALFFLFACGAPGGGVEPALPGTVTVDAVAIGFTKAPDELPFNPRAERLVKAAKQLTAIAGHPISFRIDAALLPQWRSSFEYELIGAIENVARDLAFLQANQPEVFAFAAPRFRTITFEYVAVFPGDDIGFDPATGVLPLKLTSEAGALVYEGVVTRSLGRAYEASLEHRFHDIAPEKADDLDGYFKWATTRRYDYADLSTEKGMMTDPRAETIARVARLYPRIPASANPESLQGRARQWLSKEVDYFATAYGDQEALVRSAPATSDFRLAEAAWVAWLKASIDTLDDDERREVVDRLIVERRDVGSDGKRYVDIAFPGFDVLGYDLRLVDEWIQAGRPTEFGARPQRMLLFAHIVCPALAVEWGKRRSLACGNTVYLYAADAPASLARLAEYLGRRNDATVTASAFVTLVDANDRRDAVLFLWRALKGEQWQVATRTIAEEVHDVRDRTFLLDEANRLWRASPSGHGPLLYLLTQIDSERSGSVDWKHFAQTFGSRISEADFASLLEQEGGENVAGAASVWDALSSGWSRAAHIVPHLDHFLDRWRASSMGEQAANVIDSLVTDMCEEHGDADLARMHAFLEHRASDHASERPDLERVLRRTKPGNCRAD